MTDVDLLMTRHEAVAALKPETAAKRSVQIHPRPQLQRPQLARLDGEWAFAFDDEDLGVGAGWSTGGVAFPKTITVPFPPESEASGIADRDFHSVLWYSRTITPADLERAGFREQGNRIVLHFGAVDYRADVWVDGVHVGRHEGGHTPFRVDVTDVLTESSGVARLVVRAEDDPRDVAQPRGKQDWRRNPHGIWYHRTSGIWQPVWLEAVPEVHAVDLAWQCDLAAATVTVELELNARPTAAIDVHIGLSYEGTVLVDTTVRTEEQRESIVLRLPRQTNGQEYEFLLWSPENPRLVSAEVTVHGVVADRVRSYLGLRNVGWSSRHFMLNDRPYYVRGVLAQGYWPDSLLAAPDDAAITAEVQLIKDLGFNMVRLHQKFEDPRFLAEADRLGLLVWAETPSTYEFSTTAVERLTREWLDVVRRDRSHPCIVTWVPFNESWGVQHIATDPAQLHFVQALTHLTKALDPTRPVVTNDGWEHADSDLLTVHDYGITGPDVAANYVDDTVVSEMLHGIGPLGRQMQLTTPRASARPVIVSEFGGISYAPEHEGDGWGYAVANKSSEFEVLLRELFTALQASPVLAGFCYTQLSDTLQEANGLTDGQRRPKLPIETIRSIVLGDGVDLSGQRRPKRPTEQPIDALE